MESILCYMLVDVLVASTPFFVPSPFKCILKCVLAASALQNYHDCFDGKIVWPEKSIVSDHAF